MDVNNFTTSQLLKNKNSRILFRCLAKLEKYTNIRNYNKYKVEGYVVITILDKRDAVHQGKIDPSTLTQTIPLENREQYKSAAHKDLETKINKNQRNEINHNESKEWSYFLINNVYYVMM